MNKPNAWIIYRGSGPLAELINNALAFYEKNYGCTPSYIRVSRCSETAAGEHVPAGCHVLGNGGTLINEVELPLRNGEHKQ